MKTKKSMGEFTGNEYPVGQNQDQSGPEEKAQEQKAKDERIEKQGQVLLDQNNKKHKIHL